MTYQEQIEQIVGKATELRRYRVESYMGKSQEEGYWVLGFVGDRTAAPIARFKLICMPGCCGIVISTDACVYSDYRRKGLGTILNNMRRQIAWQFGYTAMICTDVMVNIPQQRILKRNGWNTLFHFVNRRTENAVSMHGTMTVTSTGVDVGYDLFKYVR